MPTVTEEFLLQLLQACAAVAPQPLYPSRYAQEAKLDRARLDEGLDELRRRGLIHLTEWVRDRGQGCALTEAGQQALASKRLATAPAAATSAPRIEGVTDHERAELVRSAFLQPRTPYVTRILLIANLVYFAYGGIYASQHDLSVSDYLNGKSPPPNYTTNKVLIKLGALHVDLVFPAKDDVDQRPQFERIILSAFLHVGWLHLLMNMYCLYTLGPLIEAMWGTYRFATIYAVATIVSGCIVLQIGFLQHQPGITAGASGAVFGLFASLLVWFAFNKEYMPSRISSAMSSNLGVNLVLLVGINFIGNVSWQGHLGGAIGGLLAALLLHVQRFSPSRVVRALALLGIPLVPVAFFVAMLWQVGRI